MAVGASQIRLKFDLCGLGLEVIQSLENDLRVFLRHIEKVTVPRSPDKDARTFYM